MAEPSRRRKALEVLRTRLLGINTGAGYRTNVGQLVLIGERPALGENDPDATILIVVGPDAGAYQGENMTYRLPVAVQALAKVTLNDPWYTLEDVIADIKQAVEVDHDLGGTLVRLGLERVGVVPLDREEGSSFVGANVEYNLLLTEKWGVPA